MDAPRRSDTEFPATCYIDWTSSRVFGGPGERDLNVSTFQRSTLPLPAKRRPFFSVTFPVSVPSDSPRLDRVSALSPQFYRVFHLPVRCKQVDIFAEFNSRISKLVHEG